MYNNIKNKLLIITLAVIIVPAVLADTVIDHYNITYFKNIISLMPINDITTIPQNGKALTSKCSNKAIQSFDKYYSIYFKPWNEQVTFDGEELQKLLAKRPKRFAENYQLLPTTFFMEIEENANIEAISSLNQRAVMVNNSNLRILPTNSYLFADPRETGEGYPFDYAQDDYLSIGEPLLVSHYTKDGKFAYIRTVSGATGFVLSQDIAEVDSNFIRAYQKNLVVLTKDTLGYPKVENNKQSSIQLYISSVLPHTPEEEGVLLIPMKNSSGSAVLHSINVSPKNYISKPLSFSKNNVIDVVAQLIDKPYGWGGDPYLFRMDCARLVRNYMALFGIHMPLLSRDQSKQGDAIDLSSMNNLQKKNTIKTQAIPYQSIIYLPGHIGVYMGEYKGEPIFLHAAWGLKLFDDSNVEYRYIIGKSIISTLTPGKELKGFVPEKSDLLNKITLLANFNLINN
ncbi:MAG: SH3 domain-containing protein [Gammaproteobacteria bacterium]|jgi:cell wall-associated NlpC family hydrolase